MRFDSFLSMGLVLVFALFLACGTGHASAKYPKGVWQCDPAQLAEYKKVPEDVRKQWLDINDFHDEYTLSRLYGDIGGIWLHMDYVTKKADDFGLGSYGFGERYSYTVPDASIHFQDIEVNGTKLSGTLKRVKITDTALVFLGKADDGTPLQLRILGTDFFKSLNEDAPLPARIQVVLSDTQAVELPGEGVLHKVVWRYALPKK